jgi:uncharacterized lipoprotein YddW (UPF0748 family)
MRESVGAPGSGKEMAMERAPYGTLADLDKRMETHKARGGDVSQASRLLSEALDWEKRAASLASTGKAEEAEAARKQAGICADAAYCATVASRPGEFRAVWMTPTSSTDWEQVMRELEDAGFNAIFPNLNNGGSAMYPSDVLPRNTGYADRDMLGECLAAAKRHGVEVHVWRVNWALFWGTPEDFIGRLRQEGRLQLNPEGKPMSETGEWYKREALCPSHEANRRLEREAMLELVRRWPVAGIHFDYMRFPSDNQCFCPTCRERFQRELAARVTHWPQDCLPGGELLGAWRQWRRDLITSLAAEIAIAAHRIRPDVQVSLAARSGGDWTWYADGQDWPRWAREGYLDFLCPMDYTDDLSGLREALERQQGLVAGRIPLFVGHGIVRSPATLAACIELGREMGADGFLYFDYKGIREWLPTLRLGPTQAKPSVPYRAPQVSFELLGGVEASGAVRWWYRQGSEVEARVQVAPRPTSPSELKKAWAEVAVESAQGEVRKPLGRFEASPWGARIFRFSAPEGRWRLVVSGEMELADGPSQTYTVRGPLCESTYGYVQGIPFMSPSL